MTTHSNITHSAQSNIPNKLSTSSVIVFQAYVDFHATALESLINNAVEENEDKINPNSRMALGIALADIGQHAEQNYAIFCHEYGHENIMINPHTPHFNQLNSPMVKDSVEDTLSEIVNALQVTACAFCDELMKPQDNANLNVAELRGLYTALSTIRSASFVCAQSLICAEYKDQAAQQKEQDKLNKQITTYLH